MAVSVESRRRQGLRLHHTGTHLLHAALRRVLGTHVTQAGSLVAPDHLRFDFSHGAGVKDSEVEKVEQLVNEQVQANIVGEPGGDGSRRRRSRPAPWRCSARSTATACASSRSATSPPSSAAAPISTPPGEIGLFKVVSEGAVASGVRRIEAVTGEDALRHVGREEAALRESAGLLKIPPLELPRRLQKLLDDQKQLEKQLAQLEGRSRGAGRRSWCRGRGGGRRAGAGRAPRRARSRRAALGGGHAARAAGLGGHLSRLGGRRQGQPGRLGLQGPHQRFQAGKLVQEIAKLVGGGGGGRPDLAQAGGKDPTKLDEALASVPGWVERAARGSP